MNIGKILEGIVYTPFSKSSYIDGALKKWLIFTRLTSLLAFVKLCHCKINFQ